MLRQPQPRTAVPDLQRNRIPRDSPKAQAPGRLAAAIFCGALLAGCQSLLPSGRDDTVVQWRSFEEAREA